MSLYMYRSGLQPALACVALILPMLGACAKSERADDGRVPVAIHGVNHTAQEFTFVLADPLDEENIAGGETINAYGAGGAMCCFNLPKQWRSGLKAEVRATIWLDPTPEKKASPLKKRYVLDIPAYEQGKAAELWVLRTGDDEFSVVLSDLQPDHPEWPGKIKGWPVPSVEYRRIIHARSVKEAQSDVDLYEGLLAELKNQPDKHGERVWEYKMVSESKTLKIYSGSKDPAFLAVLRAEYQTGLVEAREQLRRVKAVQP